MNPEQTKWLQKQFPFTRIEKLPVCGSVRIFYRVFGASETRIVIIDPDIDQLSRFIDRAGLFRKLYVNVPTIYDYCYDLNIVLEEDLGEDTLEIIVARTDNRINLYKQVIDQLVGWQGTFDTKPHLTEDYDLPEYDYDFAYNESMLFINRYLEPCTDMTSKQIASLKPHFVDLAARASGVRKTLMHRDFQSQNILWHKDRPYFVDFQTCVFGPYAYDLAALIYDNYVDLTADEKESLIDYFYSHYPDDNRDDFYITALQRTLQAVSAYAYLSRQQGKEHYEKYLPRGLRHLEELAGRFGWEIYKWAFCK